MWFLVGLLVCGFFFIRTAVIDPTIQRRKKITENNTAVPEPQKTFYRQPISFGKIEVVYNKL